MSDPEHINQDSPAVQAHLTIEQGVIQRMSTNSASCKAWCIALVSAILIVVAEKENVNLAFLAILPTLLFLVLDAYYLALERMFRVSYRNFIKKLHRRQIESEDLFVIAPQGQLFKNVWLSVWSFSVWPFYGTLLVTTILVRWAIK
jgi:hypothetical protein